MKFFTFVLELGLRIRQKVKSLFAIIRRQNYSPYFSIKIRNTDYQHYSNTASINN